MLRKIICIFAFFIVFGLKVSAQYSENFNKEIYFDTSSIYISYSDAILVKKLDGIDVSYYQGIINWDTVKAQNISFVFIKASEGVTITDPKFQYNWECSKNVKITRGAYHFFRPNIDGKQQALLFLKVVNFEPGDLIPVVDVEYTRSIRKTRRTTYLSNLNKFMNEVYDQTGKLPIIYTSVYFWDCYYGPYFNTDNFIIWEASYTTSMISSKYFKPAVFWQYSCKGKIRGINGYVDLNYFHGYEFKNVTF